MGEDDQERVTLSGSDRGKRENKWMQGQKNVEGTGSGD